MTDTILPWLGLAIGEQDMIRTIAHAAFDSDRSVEETLRREYPGLARLADGANPQRRRYAAIVHHATEIALGLVAA